MTVLYNKKTYHYHSYILYNALCQALEKKTEKNNNLDTQ